MYKFARLLWTLACGGQSFTFKGSRALLATPERISLYTIAAPDTMFCNRPATCSLSIQRRGPASGTYVWNSALRKLSYSQLKSLFSFTSRLAASSGGQYASEVLEASGAPLLVLTCGMVRACSRYGGSSELTLTVTTSKMASLCGWRYLG